MGAFFTEADYENSVIELFRNMGYTYVYGPDLERDFKRDFNISFFFVYF